MAEFQVRTDAFNKTNETVKWKSSGELYGRMTTGRYSSYGYLVGAKGSTFKYSVVGEKGGISQDVEGVFDSVMALQDSSSLYDATRDYFDSAYSETQVEAFFNEYQLFKEKNEQAEVGSICLVVLYGIPVYEGSLKGIGVASPNESGLGGAQGNAYNNHAQLNNTYTIQSGTSPTHNYGFFDLFMILYYARETGFFEFSDIVSKMIDDNYIALQKESCVDWTINIDGSSSVANISITWNAPYMENIDNASCELRVSDSLTIGAPNAFYLGRQSYNGQPYTETWASLYEKGAHRLDIQQQLLLFLDNLISVIHANIVLFMQMSYFVDGVESKTTWCYCTINQDGEATSYGVVNPLHADGSTVSVTHRNTDDVYSDFDDDIDANIDGEGNAVSGLSLMTKSYSMSTSRLKQLGDFLWNSDFMDNIRLFNNSVLQNIISCKVFPLNITGGSDTSVVLGNINTGINGNPITENSTWKFEIGSFKIPTYYNNWLDYDSVVAVFLPFCGGFHTLDTESVMGKTISFTYYVDVLTGVCKSMMFVNNIPVQEFGGQIGFDIPLCSQDRSQTELEQISSVANMVGSVRNKDVGGLASSFMGYVAPHDYFQTSGSLSPMVNMMTTHDVFVVIERPIVQYPSNYAHTFGKPCNLTLSLNNLTGFTQCANVDVSGVPCTGEEKEMIKSYLESGVYL